MSDDSKKPEPLPPFVEDGSQDAAAIIARNEQHRRQQQAAIQSSAANSEWVPFPRPQPVYVDNGSQDAAIIAMNNEYRRRQNLAAILAAMQGGDEVFVPPDDFPILVSQSVITPYGKTDEGQLIKAVTIPLLAILQKIIQDPSRMYGIDDRAWEKIIAAAYEASGLYDEVTLTPQSGDRGRDVIAMKRGFWSVRVIESVKRYKPGPKGRVTAEEVQALLGVLLSDPQATKGVVSTTGEFAPMIWKNPQITQYIPHRLELLDGNALVERFEANITPKLK